MNRFSIACRAFVDGLNSTPSVADTRESMIAATKRNIKYAEIEVTERRTRLADAEKVLEVQRAKLAQLESLPPEAFAVLVS